MICSNWGGRRGGDAMKNCNLCELHGPFSGGKARQIEDDFSGYRGVQNLGNVTFHTPSTIEYIVH